MTEVSGGETRFLSRRKVRIEVNESFGGLAPDVHEVEVLTGAGGGDCGYPFKPGGRYLVAPTSGDRDGLLHVSVCGGAQRMEDAGVTVRLLRERLAGRPAPSLAGRIVQRDRNFQGDWGARAPKPLASAVVRVKAGGDVYETHADADGIYELYDLPAGEYEFAPELPPGFTLARYLGSDGPEAPFTLIAGACHQRDIEVFASGSIVGRVLDASKQVVENASVYIVPAGEAVPPKTALYQAIHRRGGSFQFVHLPPGEYLIVVNPYDAQDPRFPYGRTFYPGVHDRASAGVVTVRGGEEVKDVDIRLEPKFTPRRLRVRVLWADGRAVEDWVYIVARGTARSGLKSDASTDADRVGDLRLVPGERYQVHAELTCQYSDDHSVGPGASLRSSEVFLQPGDGQEELALTIPAKSCPETPGKRLVRPRSR